MPSKHSPHSPWNKENETVLVEMYAEGKTTRSIAVALQGMGYLNITRNAVIGKVHRMKLPPPNRPPKPAPGPRATRITVTRSLQSKPEVKRSGPIDETNTVPFLSIRDGQCKAILGYQDAQLSKALCCGIKTRRMVKGSRVVASPWCDEHMELYTQELYR